MNETNTTEMAVDSGADYEGSQPGIPMQTTSLYEQVERAISAMRGWKGRRARKIWRNASEDERLEICDQFCEDCCCDDNCNESGVHGMLMAGDFDHKTPYGFDVEKLQELFDLILKYLPQIIALFSKRQREQERQRWFRVPNPMATAALVLVSTWLAMGSMASAQCVGGNCYAPPLQAIQPVALTSYSIDTPPARATTLPSSYAGGPSVVYTSTEFVSAIESPTVLASTQYVPPPAMTPMSYTAAGPARSLGRGVVRVVQSRPLRTFAVGVFERRPLRSLFGRVIANRRQFGILARIGCR